MAPFTTFAKQIIRAYGQDKVDQLSAGFAFGALFSIGPLLLVLISVAGFIFGERAVQGTLFSQIADVVGPETAAALQKVVAQIHQSGNGVAAFVVGTAGLLLAVAGLTSQLQSSLNTILGVTPKRQGGLKHIVYGKLEHITLVVLGGMVVAATVLASTLLVSLGSTLQSTFGAPVFMLELFNNFAALAVLVVLLYLMYRIVPDTTIPRRLAWQAAGIVGLLFLLGKVVLGIIIGHNGTASAYGAAASLVTLLLWIYYSAQIFFLGAEGIKVYGRSHGFRPGSRPRTNRRSR